MNMHPLIMLALNANTVASTCVGDIFAMRTNGGIRKRPMISGNSVDEVKKRKVNGFMPSFSYHLRVKAVSKRAPTA